MQRGGALGVWPVGVLSVASEVDGAVTWWSFDPVTAAITDVAITNDQVTIDLVGGPQVGVLGTTTGRGVRDVVGGGRVRGLPGVRRALWYAPFSSELEDGVLTAIEEQYVP